MFPFQSPQDRPDPMEEPPPQDDDPNFSALNPMRSPLLSRDLIFKGLFSKNWGWARSFFLLTKFYKLFRIALERKIGCNILFTNKFLSLTRSEMQ